MIEKEIEQLKREKNEIEDKLVKAIVELKYKVIDLIGQAMVNELNEDFDNLEMIIVRYKETNCEYIRKRLIELFFKEIK